MAQLLRDNGLSSHVDLHLNAHAWFGRLSLASTKLCIVLLSSEYLQSPHVVEARAAVREGDVVVVPGFRHAADSQTLSAALGCSSSALCTIPSTGAFIDAYEINCKTFIHHVQRCIAGASNRYGAVVCHAQNEAAAAAWVLRNELQLRLPSEVLLLDEATLEGRTVGQCVGESGALVLVQSSASALAEPLVVAALAAAVDAGVGIVGVALGGYSYSEAATLLAHLDTRVGAEAAATMAQLGVHDVRLAAWKLANTIPTMVSVRLDVRASHGVLSATVDDVVRGMARSAPAVLPDMAEWLHRRSLPKVTHGGGVVSMLLQAAQHAVGPLATLLYPSICVEITRRMPLESVSTDGCRYGAVVCHAQNEAAAVAWVLRNELQLRLPSEVLLLDEATLEGRTVGQCVGESGALVLVQSSASALAEPLVVAALAAAVDAGVGIVGVALGGYSYSEAATLLAHLDTRVGAEAAATMAQLGVHDVRLAAWKLANTIPTMVSVRLDVRASHGVLSATVDDVVRGMARSAPAVLPDMAEWLHRRSPSSHIVNDMGASSTGDAAAPSDPCQWPAGTAACTYYLHLVLVPEAVLASSQLPQYLSNVRRLAAVEAVLGRHASFVDARRPVCLSDGRPEMIEVQLRLGRIHALVWCGCGFGLQCGTSPLPTTLESLEHLIRTADSPPRVAICYLRHGAERAARRLLAAGVRLVMWLTADPYTEGFQATLMDTVLPAIEAAHRGGAAAVTPLMSCASATASAIAPFRPASSAWTLGDVDMAITKEPWLHNVACLELAETNLLDISDPILHKGLWAHDVGAVGLIRQALYSARGGSRLWHVAASGPATSERARLVTLEACASALGARAYDHVYHLATPQQWALIKPLPLDDRCLIWVDLIDVLQAASVEGKAKGDDEMAEGFAALSAALSHNNIKTSAHGMVHVLLTVHETQWATLGELNATAAAAGMACERLSIGGSVRQDAAIRASDLHIHVPLRSTCDGKLACLLDLLPPPALEAVATCLLGHGDRLSAVYAADDASCILCLSVADVTFLQGLRDACLSGELDALLTEPLHRAVERYMGRRVELSVAIDRTQFAESYEAAVLRCARVCTLAGGAPTHLGVCHAPSIGPILVVLMRTAHLHAHTPTPAHSTADAHAPLALSCDPPYRLDRLTAHQLEKLEECRVDEDIHLTASAGTGKTFVALQVLHEALHTPAGQPPHRPILFCAMTLPLCLFVTKWLLNRCHTNAARIDVLHRLHVLHFDRGSETPVALSVLYNSTTRMLETCPVPRAEPATGAAEPPYKLVVVDEAHWVYAHEGAHEALNRLFRGERVLLLSDTSQSLGQQIPFPPMRQVSLEQVTLFASSTPRCGRRPRPSLTRQRLYTCVLLSAGDPQFAPHRCRRAQLQSRRPSPRVLP